MLQKVDFEFKFCKIIIPLNFTHLADYIVGDKVYIASNPEKTGIVTYNGTTKFSDGIWIGIFDLPIIFVFEYSLFRCRTKPASR